MIDLMKNPSVTAPTLDRLDCAGGFLSSLCAVHCICMPLLLGVLPVLGLTFLANRRVEMLVAFGMVALASGCLWMGCKVHRRWWLFVLLAIGAHLVGYAQLTAKDCCAADAFSWPNALMMTGGGLLMATTHFLNRSYRRCCAGGACNAHRL